MSYPSITIIRSSNLILGNGSVSAKPVSQDASSVRLVGTVDTWISLSGAASVGTSWLLPAGHVEYLKTAPGTVISALPDNGSAGTVNITEIG